MKRKIINTQIRIPENLHEQVKRNAEEIGVSFNSHLMELVYLGLKLRSERITFFQEDE